MAENIGALILPIGADASQFNRSINDVKAAFKELSNTIASTPFNLVTDKQKLELNALKETLNVLTTDVKEFGQALQFPENSILGLKKRIQELNDQKIKLDPTTSATEIVKLNQEIEKLEDKLENVNNLGKKVAVSSTGTSRGFTDISTASSKARQSLTSLSLVAQDLPFGFIAIQNNIPAVFQSFTELSKVAKETGVSVGSQLAAQFKGGAGALLGLGLAITAVTSIVTFAIQKYGSFGAAVDALFGKINPLKNTIDRVYKSLDDYNKELKSNAEITAVADRSQSGLAETIDILSRKATDLSTSEQERGKYLNQLKEIDKGYFGQLTTGADNIDKIKIATEGYTTALIANARVKAFQSQLDAIDAQIAPLEILRQELKKAGEEAEILRRTSTKLFVDPTDEVKTSLQKNADEIEKLYQRRELIVDGLEEAVIGFKSLKTNIEDANKTKFTLSIDPQDLDAAFNLEKIISNVTKLGNTILDTNKPLKERQEALKELIAINPQVFSGLTLEKSGLTNLKTTVEAYTRSLQILIKEREFDARVSQINTQLRNAEIKKTEDAVKVSNDKVKSYEDQFENIVRLTYAQDQYGNSTDKITDKSLSFLKVLKQQQDISAAINKALNNIYGPGTAEENDPVKRVEELSKRIKQAKDNFENTIRRGLQQPFEDFFSTLIETGKFSLDSFEGLFKDMLKRIAAQIVSAGIAKLISSILFPPSAAAGALAGAAAGKQSGGIIDALISLFGGRRAFNNVNFGGIEGGGMQMSGQVVFVQRGSDLVGVLNRTNGTINRVG
jgi:hypothetical protein